MMEYFLLNRKQVLWGRWTGFLEGRGKKGDRVQYLRRGIRKGL